MRIHRLRIRYRTLESERVMAETPYFNRKILLNELGSDHDIID